MKRAAVFYLIILIALSNLLSQSYFGQTIPGKIPEVFASRIVSTEFGVYANVAFHPNLTEACWTPNTDNDSIYRGGIFLSKFEDGTWSNPGEIRFLDEQYGHRSPTYSHDGNRLYFQGYLKSQQGWDQKEKFYYVERTESGWSEPELLDSIFNKYSVHWQFSLDHKDNIYFGGDLRDQENTGGIYVARHLDGKYQEPELVFSNQELDEAVFAPAIAPNKEYILFARIHPRGSTNPRIFSIYISFAEAGNAWSEPIELGALLNMDGNQPRISPDGKFIFFVGNDGMSNWVSSEIIEELEIRKDI
jgi:hypothetical protein